MQNADWRPAKQILGIGQEKNDTEKRRNGETGIRGQRSEDRRRGRRSQIEGI